MKINQVPKGQFFSVISTLKADKLIMFDKELLTVLNMYYESWACKKDECVIVLAVRTRSFTFTFEHCELFLQNAVLD